MQARLRGELAKGALGIGVGINYTPGASRLEVLEIFRVAAERATPLWPHIRAAGYSEPGSSVESVGEVIAAAAVTGAPLHIVHINSMGLGQVFECMKMIEGGAAYWASNGIGEGADFRFGFEGTPPSIIVSAAYGPYFFRPVTVLDDLGVDGGDLTLYTGNGFKPGGGSWAVQSDARLKHHVEPLDNALDHLLALRGVNYEYLPSTSPLRRPGKHVGFIAQEVREVFPEWVGEGKDGYLFVAPTGFEALTVEALRDLKAEQDVEVESLRAANQQMHSELDALRREIDSLRASVVAAARN